MKTLRTGFEEYCVSTHPGPMDGVQKIFVFPNGRGASVICHSMSYGGDDGLWELGVLNRNGVLDYSTPITDNVVGWLNDDSVNELLIKIFEMEAE